MSSPASSPASPWEAGVKGVQVLPLINADAPVIRVEAGPGTGKTFGLARRVLRLMHPDGLAVDAKDILIVAFNRVIARDLEFNVRSGLQGFGFAIPQVSTVHGVCHSAIDDDRRILLPHEREAMLYDLRILYPTEFTVPFESLSQKLNDHEAEHQVDPFLASAVDVWLTRHRARLVGDLPTTLLAQIHGGDHEDLRFRHVVVDEFQDLTPAEQRLVVGLRTSDGTLLALGDPNQSIYAFRGNDPLGLAKLDVLTGRDVTDLTMVECQRCPTSVVEAVNELMVLANTPMQGVSEADPNIHLVHWSTPVDEAVGMATHIFANWSANPGETHLVMVTRRKLGYMLRNELRKLNADLEVDLAFSESLLETWEARDAFLFFCLLVDPDPGTWRGWLGLQVSGATQSKAANRNAAAYLRFLDGAGDDITLDRVRALATEGRNVHRGAGGRNLWDRAKRLVELVDSENWNDLSPAQLIDRALAVAMWVDPNDSQSEAADDLQLIQDQALRTLAERKLRSPNDERGELLQAVARDLRFRIAVREPFSERTESRIQVTTLWGAKGLTASHVFVLGLCDEALPGRRSDEYPGTDKDFVAEQRRLFYVAMTRTKHTLVLSQLKGVKRSFGKQLGLDVGSGKEWGLGKLKTSRFITQIGSHLPPSVPGPTWGGCA